MRKNIALMIFLVILYIYLNDPERRRVFWLQITEALTGRVPAGDDFDLWEDDDG